MTDNEKLLEAERMIKRHCKETAKDNPCCFAFSGICRGIENCQIGDCDMYPCDWNIKSRWTDADLNMARALSYDGYSEIKRSETGAVNCMVKEPDDSWFGLPSAFFKPVKAGETVQLSDIIAEGADQ